MAEHGLSAFRTAVAGAWARGASRAAARRPALAFGRRLAEAIETEWEHRRFFLWLPALSGTGVLLFLQADREPVVWLPALLLAGMALLALRVRGHRPALLLAVGIAAVAAGFLAAEFRTAQLAQPVLTRIRISKMTGVIEEVDGRRTGSRFILQVLDAEGLAPAERPRRIRLTTRRDEPLLAGSTVTLTARLLPPSGPALPGGFSFARDSFFMGLGAVGSVLGRVQPAPVAAELGWRLRLFCAIDRTRNALAKRVDTMLGGDTGAIGAAMVTGKRDLLSEDGRTIIREAGIFHIITIAGVQMTLVAGLLFGLTRRGLALVPALALHRPIKKWAALVAIVGAVGYDLLTGSRIGTQRALIMTLVMLGAILADRRALTMRNLALAALAVILIEPEAVTGASFQLSFAAVAALVAVYEARQRHRERNPEGRDGRRDRRANLGLWHWPARALDHGRAMMVVTLCASAATASFMAADFHELSPWVVVGNPVTLLVIEFFAVPGALVGCVLYPLGLDGWVWSWVGFGIRIVMAVATRIAAAPGATLTVPAFAPWALPLLTLAVLSAVIWRSPLLRLTAVPLALLGLLGATLGPRYDLIVAPGGDAVAVRAPSGRLALVGRIDGFAAEQWVRADGDGRAVAGLRGRLAELGRCDALGCVVPLPGGQTLSLVTDRAAFEEDCRRADAIVTSLVAPASCEAPLIVDRASLAATGSLGLWRQNGGWVTAAARGPMEDRPWSRPPAPPRSAHTWSVPANNEPRRPAPREAAPPDTAPDNLSPDDSAPAAALEPAEN